MVQLISFCLICYGITAILTKSYLLEWYRNLFKNKYLKYLVNCSQCTGFWIGIFISILISLQICTVDLIGYVLQGFISSGVCYIVQSIIESKSNENNEDEIHFNITSDDNK